jgi:predicted ATPase/DNA-binding CsgD family transcriptional regulator
VGAIDCMSPTQGFPGNLDACVVRLVKPTLVRSLNCGGVDIQVTETSEPARRERTNLPVDISSFIGRRQQVIRARAAVRDRRLVTLTGIGGVGKTRLARRVAASASRSFDTGGVWYVELGAVGDPALVPRAIADVLRVRDVGSSPVIDLLVERLSDADTLLVLDNCEHVLDGVVESVEQLLGASRSLHVLATSRRALGIVGEAVVPVEPLRAVEARQLFLERATAACAYTPGDGDDAMIDRLCDRLDRLPLALELAASRLNTIALPEMLGLLEATGVLAPLGSRRGVSRQRTLRAAFDWSHELLNEPERGAWRRLAVFESGFRLEGARALLGDDALGLVAGLVDNSIVSAEPRGGRTWYRMLEMIRDYGRERLVAAGEQADVERRFVSHYVAMVEEVERVQSGPDDDARWPDELDNEQGNLRLALELAGAGQGTDQVRLAAALVPYWDVRGHLVEGRGWLQAALSRPETGTALRASGLEGLGWLAFRQGDYSAAESISEEACLAAEEAGDQALLARARSNVGLIALLGGRLEAAGPHLERSLRIARAAGLRAVEVGPLFMIALLDYLTGDLAAAVVHGEECLAVVREHGNLRMRAVVCALMGSLRLELHETDAAGLLLQEAVGIEGQIGERLNVPLILGACARLAEARGEHERCVVLGAAACLAGRTSESGRVDVWQERVDEAVARATAALGRRAADAAWRRGMEIDITRALHLAGGKEPGDVRPAPNGLPALTKREAEIAKLIAEGLTNRAVAGRLHVGQRTVETHVENILNKLGARSRSEVAARAMRPDELRG